MRKARAFSTPGDVVGGGGVALLLKKEAMVLCAVRCRLLCLAPGVATAGSAL